VVPPIQDFSTASFSQGKNKKGVRTSVKICAVPTGQNWRKNEARALQIKQDDVGLFGDREWLHR
jgi:hypothetical protein